MMKEKNIKWITLGIIFVSLVLIMGGIFRGEAVVVLTKATAICMQCIGIQ